MFSRLLLFYSSCSRVALSFRRQKKKSVSVNCCTSEKVSIGKMHFTRKQRGKATRGKNLYFPSVFFIVLGPCTGEYQDCTGLYRNLTCFHLLTFSLHAPSQHKLGMSTDPSILVRISILNSLSTSSLLARFRSATGCPPTDSHGVPPRRSIVRPWASLRPPSWSTPTGRRPP